MSQWRCYCPTKLIVWAERCLKMATFEPIIVSSALTNGEN